MQEERLTAALKRCATRKNCTGAAVVSVKFCLPKNQFTEMASCNRRQVRLQEPVRTRSDGAHTMRDGKRGGRRGNRVESARRSQRFRGGGRQRVAAFSGACARVQVLPYRL